MFGDKKYAGIADAIIFSIAFVFIALFGRLFFVNGGAGWYYFSSLHRLIFGMIATYDCCKLYDVNLGQVFSLKNWKFALIAGSGFLIYGIAYTVTLCVGVKEFVGLTVPVVIAHIFLQQITTGFYEETVYRGLILGGYFEQEDRSWKKRVVYAFVSFVIFGSIHLIDGNWQTFVFTGSIGFAFAAIYLKSHNIFIPMLLHFVYDVAANLSYYVEFDQTELFSRMVSLLDPILVLMFVISLIVIIMPHSKDEALEEQVEEEYDYI